jgi:hypothetical protein
MLKAFIFNEKCDLMYTKGGKQRCYHWTLAEIRAVYLRYLCTQLEDEGLYHVLRETVVQHVYNI